MLMKTFMLVAIISNSYATEKVEIEDHVNARRSKVIHMLSNGELFKSALFVSGSSIPGLGVDPELEVFYGLRPRVGSLTSHHIDRSVTSVPVIDKEVNSDVKLSKMADMREPSRYYGFAPALGCGFSFTRDFQPIKAPLSEIIDENWVKKGNFDLYDSGRDNLGKSYPLNRHFVIKSNNSDSKIDKISVFGYRNGEVLIEANFRKDMPEIENELRSKKLIREMWHLIYPHVMSKNTQSNHEFLSILLNNNLINTSVMNTILSEISEKNGSYAF